MEFLSREEIMEDMAGLLDSIMNKYKLDDIGIYEEEGEDDQYFMGYTVRKNGKVFMINLPFTKNKENKLALQNEVWTIQEEKGESKGYKSLEEVFEKIDQDILH